MKTATQIAFETATDENDHTGATQILCLAMIEHRPENPVYSAYAVILENIKMTQILVGEMPANLGKMRDAIQSDLIADCRLFKIIA